MNQKRCEEIMESYLNGNREWACTQIRTKKDLAELIVYIIGEALPGTARNICESILARTR